MTDLTSGHRLRLGQVIAMSWLAACAPQPEMWAQPTHAPTPLYPPTRTAEVVDDYHGTPVADPYRWLEDLSARETRAWMAAQSDVLSAHLAGDGMRGQTHRRMSEMLHRLDEFSVPDLPVTAAGREFRLAPDGRTLHVRMHADAEAGVLIDAGDHSPVATITRFHPSPDGRHVAYLLSAGGSDWMEMRIRRVDDREELPEVLGGLIFPSFAWTPDGSGILYAHYERPLPGDRAAMRSPSLRHHRLVTPQSEDRTVFASPPGTGAVVLGVDVSPDGRFALLYEGSGSHQGALGWALTRMHYLDLTARDAEGGFPAPVALNASQDAAYRLIHVADRWIYVFTSRNAPRHRLVAIDLRNPGPEHWRDVIPESDGVLQSVHRVGDVFVAAYLENVHSVLRVFSESGKPVRQIELPTLGSVYDIRVGPEAAALTFTFSSFTYPDATLRHDLTTGRTTVLRRLENGFDPAAFVTRQLWFTSRDGTRVPMFVAHRMGLDLDGSHPTILWGYGASGTPQLPAFTEDVATWLEADGVYAVANVRGGGEFGQAWYEAAILERKQTSVDDFIAAAEHLIAAGYTAPARLAIRGNSFGGMLVGAALTQRPALFAAAVLEVPVLDLLRMVPGRHEAQLGSAANPEQFPFIYAYSPLHRIREGVCYPATFLAAPLNDDRVPAWHAAKFTAALQAAQGCPRPVLLRTTELGGHAGHVDDAALAARMADTWSFVARHTGLLWNARPE
jgi:prolyl oligopeptidase